MFQLTCMTLPQKKLADLLLATESLVLTGSDLLNKCGLKPNMIVKALESRLVRPVIEHRGWKRIRSMEYKKLKRTINSGRLK